MTAGSDEGMTVGEMLDRYGVKAKEEPLRTRLLHSLTLEELRELHSRYPTLASIEHTLVNRGIEAIKRIDL